MGVRWVLERGVGLGIGSIIALEATCLCSPLDPSTPLLEDLMGDHSMLVWGS
jgi:hypothetical protein